MKRVKVEDAVGMVVGHDLTKVVPGSYKGPAFRKGHIITIDDIQHLKDIGKEHIYIVELTTEQLHENDAAAAIAQNIAWINIKLTTASEGRVNLIAAERGILKINKQAVAAINNVGGVAVATKHADIVVTAGEMVAAVKIVPLVIDLKTVEQVQLYKKIIRVEPMQNLKVAAIITGNEVYYGRIKDKFRGVIEEKLKQYSGELVEVIYQPDDYNLITQSILACREKGAEVIIVSGGMSVDPDDVTPEAIRKTNAEVIIYGTPVLPGAMFMLAYLDETAIIGLPACGMYAKTTVFDILFPRILAGERLKKADIVSLGYGGLCINCAICQYPNCPFGK